ncbi:MAG: deoxyribonuclease V [Alphaproteobacteria bacterium]
MGHISPVDLTTWPKDIASAMSTQNLLREKIRTYDDDFSSIKLIVGIDVSYDIYSNTCFAFIVVTELPNLKPKCFMTARLAITFPYIPGFLSFREIPVIMAALSQLTEKPDLLMVDGQGIAHPRRFGIASHLGVLTDLPTIGIAKSRLVGYYEEPRNQKGAKAFLFDGEEHIGTVLRSQDNMLPIFISPGHRISQDTAVDIAIQCLKFHRLPEPMRLADKLAKQRPLEESDIFFTRR